jgi:hypothetical protein
MADIQALPLKELVNDWTESVNDIRLCEVALSRGITEYNGRDVKSRLERNKQIKAMIDAELERRKIAAGGFRCGR